MNWRIQPIKLNLQNLPVQGRESRRDEVKRILSAFQPPIKFTECDYSRIERRVVEREILSVMIAARYRP